MLGLLPIIKGSRDYQDLSFSVLAFLSGIWTISNFLGSNVTNPGVGAALIKVDFISGVFLVNSFWVFAYLTKKRFLGIAYSLKLLVLGLSTSIFVAVLILADQVVETSFNNGLIVSNKQLYPVYLLVAGIFMILGIKELIVARYKSIGIRRTQASTMLLGLVVAATLVAIPNLVLTNFFERSNLLLLAYDLSYVGIFIFLALSAYTIIRHRLFDIRSVIARSVVYILLIPILISIYSLVIFGFTNVLFQEANKVGFGQQVVYIATAIFMALTYQYIKKQFDRITNRLFFRDSYDTQVVLDKVSNVIVGSIDPHKVQKGALAALSVALKPTYMVFLFKDGPELLRRGDIIGQQWNMHEPHALAQSLKKLGKKIVIYDEMEEKKGGLRDVLRVEDINLVAPLFTKDDTIGYLIIGQKKSGNVYGTQDIGLLNIATNELAVALQNAQRFEEIQAFNITLQEKITDATRELKSTNKKLVALDEAKDEFISMASHQLRTPLTSIKGYLSMILEEDLGKVNPAQEKALKEAFGSSQRMVYLIADFLNVSRIKTGKFMIETKEVDLPEIVREELTQLREMAGSRELTLKYDQPEVFPRVKLDDNKIRQVMMNMVDNAIYYTPTGGTITIQLYSTGDEVIFKVIDSGIGVPKEEQHKLFTKFYRAGNARKSRPDGTGLGLFMAQKIVVEQGGAIIFESEEGKGSTFGWRFPLSKIRA